MYVGYITSLYNFELQDAARETTEEEKDDVMGLADEVRETYD